MYALPWKRTQEVRLAVAVKRICKYKPVAYVYVINDENGIPFYVGKGTNKRISHHENLAGRLLSGEITAKQLRSRGENLHRINSIIYAQKNGRGVTYDVLPFSSEEEAYAVEARLVEKYQQRWFLPLCNISCGGRGGGAGKVTSLATRKKIRRAMLGRKHSEATRQKISAAHKGRVHSEQSRRNMSQGQIGKKCPLSPKRQAATAKTRKPVVVFGKWYPSVIQCARILKVDASAISHRLRRKADAHYA